uniref:Uncharacterized protein n=1 Tax=Haplochromis burtoni TaxID=8153 RepID=A0A3Q2X1X4_HAPBU
SFIVTFYLFVGIFAQQAVPRREDQVQAGRGASWQRHRLAVRARPDYAAENRLLRTTVGTHETLWERGPLLLQMVRN